MADLIERVNELTTAPGCYVFKDAAGDEIYVGKAKNLRKRVQSYFQRGEAHPVRTLRLVQEIADVEVFETGSEVEALLLENRLIKDLQPRFNVRLKDDKTYPLLAITREEFPRVYLTREQRKPGVDYYGPFGSMTELRRAYHFLMRVFQFRVCTLDISEDDPKRKHFRPCLNYHIKRCSAPCTLKVDREQYGRDIKGLRGVLTGRGVGGIARDLREQMETASADMAYEEAARYRDQLAAVESLRERGDLADHDVGPAPVVTADTALSSVQRALQLDQPPRVIEGFDIAHLQGTDVVASMVQFVDGVPNRDGYRRFRVKAAELERRNDDFAAMSEVVGRRYRRLRDEGAALPDVVLIDGGLGQVHAARDILAELEVSVGCLVGLAKKEELLVLPDGSEIKLTRRNPGLKLLMYVRDEAHRFCRRYHHLLRAKGLR